VIIILKNIFAQI